MFTFICTHIYNTCICIFGGCGGGCGGGWVSVCQREKERQKERVFLRDVTTPHVQIYFYIIPYDIKHYKMLGIPS